MKKNKKIPNTPKYKFGGFPKLEQGLKDYGLGLADSALGTLGAGNVIKDSQYSDTGFGNAMKKGSAISGALTKTAAGMIPGYGQFISAGQGLIGQAVGPDKSQYDEQGNPINPNMQQAIGMAGQIGGMAGGFMGKYGGQMKFAMGGMNRYPGGGTGEGTGQVEKDENSVAPNNNNKFTQYDELDHNQQDPNQPNASLDPGEMVFTARFGPKGKKGPSWADLNKANNTNREDKLLKDSTLSKASALSLHLTKMAKVKNSYNLFYNGQEAQKEEMASKAFDRTIKKYGVPPQLKNLQPSRDNESIESQGEMPMVRHGGMFAMGGVQLPYYNTDNAGNPIYKNGGKTPKSQERLNQEKFVNDYYDELSQNQFASMANLQGKRSGPDIWTPSMQMINNFRSNPNLDKLSDEKYAELTNQALSGVGFLRKKYEPYLHEDFTDVPKKYAMGGGYPAMTNPYNNFRGSIPMYDDGGNMPEDPNNVLTGPINFNTNPELISNAANVGGYNAFYKFLNNQKINNEPVLNNKELNTTEGRKKYTEKFINDFNNSDYIKKFPNNKITQDQIKMQQAYHKLSDENVLVDGWVGSQTSRMNYPIQHHVFTRKSNDINSPDYNTPKDSSFVNVSYGNKNYVIPAKSYKYNSVDNIKNMQYSPTDTTLYKPRVVNAGEFKYGGQMQMPKFWGGGPYIDPSETGMQEQADMNAYYDNLNRKTNNNNFVNSNGFVGNIPTNFNFERSRAFNKEQNQTTKAFNQMTGNTNPGFSTYNSEAQNTLPSSYAPGTMGYNDSMNSPQNPSNDSLQSSYGPSVLPWNRTNDSNQGPNGAAQKYTMENPTQQFQEATTSGSPNITQTNPNSNNKPNWMKTLGNVGNFAAQNAPNIYNAFRYDKPEVETYERAQAKYVDPAKAIANENYIYRQTKDAAPGLTGGNAGATLAALGANKAGTATRIGRLRETYDNVNAQIGNQVNQYNTELSRAEVIANAQNRARNRSGKGEWIGDTAKSFAQMQLDNKKGATDEKTLAMYKEYYNNPQFRAALKKAGYDV